MKKRSHSLRARSGQAMIELMLGVILILILLAGAVQFVTVSDAHSAIDSRIRGRTGFLAMQPLTIEDTPDYIKTWSPGADEQRFTADDKPQLTLPLAVQMIANGSVSDATEWSVFDQLSHPSSLAALRQTPFPSAALGFIGVRMSVVVPVSEIAQELFYNKADVTVQEDCWVPIMNGLY